MSSNGQGQTPKQLAISALGALGVVYGDIGTSPLYAVRECFHPSHGLALDEANVLGVLSLIVWSLIVVVTLKYVAYVLRADNDGEGGILALYALAMDPDRPITKQPIIYALGLFGAALLYGDGIITPAISVLGAVEGLEVEAPSLDHAVIPITIAILVAIFWVQRKGTASVGMLFGPITLVWFLTLALIAIPHLLAHPEIFRAVLPTYAVGYFIHHGLAGVTVLGSVFLVVTGGEALYADMGHFGVKPIRFAWFLVVLPALLIHYFGQGAFLLAHPAGLEHPVMHMSPSWARIPVLIISTAAAVIASQALISGTFSITRQAILLGYVPRLTVVHTSSHQIGQIYLPFINGMMMLGTIALVLGFGSSTALAAAYGIAVTGTMVITTVLAHVVATRRWGWPPVLAGILTLSFLVVDLAFLGANSLKFWEGGWVPVVIAVGIFILFTTWRRGRQILGERIRERAIAISSLGDWLKEAAPTSVPGTAVYLTGHPDSAPLALIDNVRHNHALHERVILLSIAFTQTARVTVTNRLRVERLDDRIVRVFGYYGFVESPDVPHLLELALLEGLEVDPATVTYVLGRETLLATDRPGMWLWRELLFAFMSRNAQRAATFFGIPPQRVLEVGTHIEL